jgi:prepilin-type N-terminal cleavage/methylation domain-containing protein
LRPDGSPAAIQNKEKSVIERLQAKRNEEGFTLIELLIVIIVLGILAAIVVFAVAGTKKDALSATCKTDVKSIELSAESVLAKTGTYTSLTQVQQTDLTSAPMGGLLKTFPSNSAYTLTWTGGAVVVSAPGGVSSCAGLSS